MLNFCQRIFALCHKAWRESRAMFGACAFITFVNTWLAFDRSYEAVLAKRLVNPSPFEVLDGTYRIWGILFAVLGAGCMLWERRQGGAAFSFGLPVRIAHFHLVRAAVGFLQVAFLGSVPSFLAGWLHQAFRPELQVPPLFAFTTVGIALSMASFGLAFLMSAILPNLYLAIGAGWLAAVGFSFVVAQIPGLDEISGMKILRELGSLPAKPIAWYPVGVYAASAILAVVVGAYVAEYRSQLEA